MRTGLEDQLERSKHELLDLTARNRLLNTPLSRDRSTRVDIVDELTSKIFRILVQERREMSFLPTKEDDGLEADDAVGADSNQGNLRTTKRKSGDGQPRLFQPEEESDEEGIDARHTDRNLQTALVDEKLQTRLLRLYYDSKAMYEEQGVNSLFLALGFLEWYESTSSDKVRFAPLVLVPVELHRRTVNARFKLRFLEEEVSTNLSLQAKLKAEFGLQLPDLPDLDDLVPGEYFESVEQIIADQPRWKIHRDRMTLWFFSFAKFLMYRDLDPDNWPEGKGPLQHPLVNALLGEPVVFEPPLIGENEPLDERLDPQSQCHVVDADSSQAAAIEEVRNGRNLVIQGPPGTGKSQSIVNVIASAVRDGKTVLFVAEKLAALQVVKSRLDRIGLGDLCLELHSHKANRRSVLDDLGRTLELGRPANFNSKEKGEELRQIRDRLNEYVRQLHTPVEPSGRTPYELIGTLCRLQADGVGHLNCSMPGIEAWSTTALQEKQSLLRDLMEHLGEIGVPEDHVWHGVHRTTPMLPSDQQFLQETLVTACEGTRDLLEIATRLAEQLHISWDPDRESFQSIQRLLRFSSRLRRIPDTDRQAFAHPIWETDRNSIQEVIDRGRELERCRAALTGRIKSAAWEMDVRAVRDDLSATGNSLFRWFSRRWWRAIIAFRSLMESPQPKTLEDQLSVLDQLMTAQACVSDLTESASFGQTGKAAFGTLWHGVESDWDALAAIVEWEVDCLSSGVPKGFRRAISYCPNMEDIEPAYRALAGRVRPTWDSLRRIVKELEISVHQTFGNDRLAEVPAADILSRLSACRDDIGQLGRWIVFQRRLAELEKLGLAPLRPQFEQGDIDERCVQGLELMFCEAGMRQVLSEREQIAAFDGISQNRLVDVFRRLDEERVRQSRTEVAAAHYNRLPTGGDAGEVGLIRGEIRKKRRHRSLRRLLADAGRAVQAIKPVFMMSPISVAQFLEPGVLSFDLLVIDEASQVRPVEAFGAVLRCQQATVIGDNRQLPPTAFFDRVVSGEEEADDQEATEAADVESILDLCLARNFPQRMLRWHYRSRHHSLIAVSNREFYNNRLYVVPSPEREGTGNGLKFQFVADGVYDRGRTRTNRREAQAVARAMIEHACQHPNLSLGVGTFSVAQRDAILDELELLRRSHPEAEEFFSRTDGERWFVKNLENIQGDERDSIFISVGYGKDESGFQSMSFGPLTAKGGERRLNVLISRARQRCAVFSSIRSDDIDLRRAASRGAAALKSFLQYAESGQIELSRPANRECDSEFEAQVADAIRSCGFEVDHQVGIAGFFIDIAVIDPEAPGRYVLGIECDGATYNSARWARDRDRLRQAVLEDHGWKLYRIWSTDWFHGREEQMRQLLAAIEDLRLLNRQRQRQIDGKQLVSSSAFQSPEPAQNDSCTEEILRVLVDNNESNGQLSTPYIEAQFSHPAMGSRDIHDLPPTELAEIVSKVVRAEGPVHRDEVARRVTTLWGLQKTGSRIRKSVHRALRVAEQQDRVVGLAGFYTRAGQKEFPIRSRENVVSQSLRKPEMLPPQEIDAAVAVFIASHISASVDETVRSVARLLGFRSTGQQLRSRIESRIDFLVSGGNLQKDGEVLRTQK